MKNEVAVASPPSAGVSGTCRGLAVPVDDDAESLRKLVKAVAYSSEIKVIVRRVILVTTSSGEARNKSAERGRDCSSRIE